MERRVEATVGFYAILGVPQSEIISHNFSEGGFSKHMLRRVGVVGALRCERDYAA